MKTILLTTVFAAVAVAQDPNTSGQPGKPGQEGPRVELAHALALEEQEGDLARAEVAYRQALDGELSSAARSLACERLGLLLCRLGRVDEGKRWIARAVGPKGTAISLDDVTGEFQGLGQDPAREAALREQAQVLVEQISRRGHSHGTQGSSIDGLEKQVAEQLLWIGQPAVPEIVAVLERGPKQESAVPVLLRSLWRLGGEQAQAFLVESTKGELARTVASTASSALEIDVEGPAARACLRHPDPAVVLGFLQSPRSLPSPHDALWHLHHFVSAAVMIEAAELGAPPVQAFVFHGLRRRSLTDQELARVHELVRRGLAGTDPKLGQAAEAFLTGASSQRSLLGVTMLLERLPALQQKGVHIDHLPQRKEIAVSQGTATTSSAADQRADRLPVFAFDVEAARAMVPRIDLTIGAMGRTRSPNDQAVRWLYSLQQAVIVALGDEAVPPVLRWWDAGFELWDDLFGHVSSAQVPELFARYDRVAETRRHLFLHLLKDVGMPAGMFDALREQAAAETDGDRRNLLAAMMVETGNAEVLPWLLSEWRRDCLHPDWVAHLVIVVARRDRSDALRAAFDSLLRGFGGPKPSSRSSASLLLAWLSMGDPKALDFVEVGAATAAVPHPYRDDQVKLKPIMYVMYDNPDPPHGFTEQQIFDTVQRCLAVDEMRNAFAPRNLSVPAIGDAALAAIAEVEWSVFSETGGNEVFWRRVALSRLATRIEKQQPAPALERWLLGMLGNDELAMGWFDRVDEQIVDRYGDRLEALIDGEHANWAYLSVQALWRHDWPVDLGRLAQNRHAIVREFAVRQLAQDPGVAAPVFMALLADEAEDIRRHAADRLGAMVAKEAVPALIELLRDSEPVVREAAAQALTRIRFYHEQEAHWQRVLKGLDASPASAAEKLLLQARPEAPKAQRLLAMESLGVLGVPEALPFLIDWSNEADPQIKAAAKAAITKIHLEPRR